MATKTPTPTGSCSTSKIGGDEDDAPMMLSSTSKIGGSSDAVVVDRNVADVPDPMMLISTSKIGGSGKDVVVERSIAGVSAPMMLSSTSKIGGSGKDVVVERSIAGVSAPMMLSSTSKIGGSGKDVVVEKNVAGVPDPMMLCSTSKIGGSGKDVVVDRNVAGVPDPMMLCSTSKIGGGEDIYVATPVVDGNKLKIAVPLQRLIGGSGKDRSKVRIEVPIPKRLLLPSARWPDHAQLLVQNHMNFKESGKPVRFMVYKDRQWVNFEKNVMDMLVSGFVSGKPMVEVEREGFKLFIDFYRMLGTELNSGKEMSISWIDVNNKCFFPKVFIDLDKKKEIEVSSENPKIELEMNSAGEELGKRKRGSEENELEKGEGSSSNAKERRVVATELLPPKWPRTRSLREEERLYQMAKGLFLSALRAGVTVTAVHQCTRTGPMEQARFEVFEKSVETVRRARGNQNVVEYAWYGTSSKNVDSIMRRGFEISRIVPGSYSHGVGIYLSPVRSPQNSEMMAEVDENGEKHFILCQVILGKLEKVEVGSQQLFPSSADFDTGVDDLNNPKLYVVWRGNMNTHILPMCIVSYKSARDMSGQLNGASHAHYAWSTLQSKLNSLLPPPKVLELQRLFGCYREGKVGKEIFKRQLRSLVGDQMLRSIILEIRG